MRAMTTWFCDAYASWQKGGLNCRRSMTTLVAASVDIDKVSDEEIQDIVITANLTPQKMPWLQELLSGNPQRPWQRRANPVHVKLCCTWL